MSSLAAGLLRSSEEYIQDGTGEPALPNLTRIPYSLQPHLKSITLTRLLVNPDRLLNCLEHCSALQSLTLSKVDFSAPFQSRRTVTLPSLRTYSLDIGLNTEVGDFNRKPVFGSWFPFLPSPDDVDGLTQLGIDLELVGPDDGLILKLIHAQGTLISKLQWTNDILTNIQPDQFSLKKLVVFFCRASIHINSFPPSLTQLELTEVKINEGCLSDIFRNCPLLETLYLNTVREDDGEESQLNLTDLSQLSRLRALWLINDIKVTGYESPLDIQFPCLDELILDWRVESLDPDIIQNLGSIFPNLRVVMLAMHNRLVNSMLERVVTLGSVEKILFKTYYIKEMRTEELEPRLKDILTRINPNDVELYYLEQGKGKESGKWAGEPIESGNFGPFLRNLIKSPFVALF